MSAFSFHTTLVTDHLEQGQVGGQNVVEVDFGVLPRDIHLGGLVAAVSLAVDDGPVDDATVGVDTRTKPAAEQVDTHDAEDEPEDEADQQHVEDGRDCLDQRVHHHLHPAYVRSSILISGLINFAK